MVYCSFLGVGFQSTLPARGATSDSQKIPLYSTISIHTPREGSDAESAGEPSADDDFNPHSPRGERHQIVRRRGGRAGFQSTLPARGATPARRKCSFGSSISIHTPREGSDLR